MQGAEGAMGSSLGQAKRSPRLQATTTIGPEGTGANTAHLFRPFRTEIPGSPYPGAALCLPQATICDPFGVFETSTRAQDTGSSICGELQAEPIQWRKAALRIPGFILSIL